MDFKALNEEVKTILSEGLQTVLGKYVIPVSSEPMHLEKDPINDLERLFGLKIKEEFRLGIASWAKNKLYYIPASDFDYYMYEYDPDKEEWKKQKPCLFNKANWETNEEIQRFLQFTKHISKEEADKIVNPDKYSSTKTDKITKDMLIDKIKELQNPTPEQLAKILAAIEG